MENKDLLTKEEIIKVWNDVGDGATWGEYTQAIARAQLSKVLDAGYLSPEEHKIERDKVAINIKGLFTPAKVEAKIEEARKEERSRLMKKGMLTEKQFLFKFYNMAKQKDGVWAILKKIVDNEIEEAKEQERERIIKYIEIQGKYNLSAITQLDLFLSPMWQALTQPE